MVGQHIHASQTGFRQIQKRQVQSQVQSQAQSPAQKRSGQTSAFGMDSHMRAAMTLSDALREAHTCQLYVKRHLAKMPATRLEARSAQNADLFDMTLSESADETAHAREQEPGRYKIQAEKQDQAEIGQIRHISCRSEGSPASQRVGHEICEHILASLREQIAQEGEQSLKPISASEKSSIEMSMPEQLALI